MKKYVVLALKEETVIDIGGKETTLPISEMADDCAGCLLVFNNKETAKKYAGKKYHIIEIETKE